jgi:hypothetical protein
MQDMRSIWNKIQCKEKLHKSDMQQVKPRYGQSCSHMQDLVGTSNPEYCFCGMCLWKLN